MVTSAKLVQPAIQQYPTFWSTVSPPNETDTKHVQSRIQLNPTSLSAVNPSKETDAKFVQSRIQLEPTFWSVVSPLKETDTKLVQLNTPNLLLFVGEALVGNDGIDQLLMFNKALATYLPSNQQHEIDGIVLTKFDTIQRFCVSFLVVNRYLTLPLRPTLFEQALLLSFDTPEQREEYERHQRHYHDHSHVIRHDDYTACSTP